MDVASRLSTYSCVVGFFFGAEIGRLVSDPTFWAAVQALGAIVALFLIYRQIADGRQVSAYEFLRREDDRFHSDRMTQHRSRVARMLLSRPSSRADRDKYYEDTEDHFGHDLRQVLGYFEDLGLLLRRRLVPEFFVWTTSCSYVVHYWKLLADWIEWYRRTEGDPTYYTEFEHLHTRMARFERCKRHSDAVEPTGSQLNEFLESELHTTLRSFSASDLDAVMRIENMSFGVEAYTRAKFQELFEDHPEGFRVAEIPGELVGYIIGYLTEGVGEIDSIAVAPAYRRIGVARYLINAALDDLRNLGASRCMLEVRTTNDAAIRFYDSMGFRQVDTIAAYYQDGGDAFRMERAL